MVQEAAPSQLCPCVLGERRYPHHEWLDTKVMGLACTGVIGGGRSSLILESPTPSTGEQNAEVPQASDDGAGLEQEQQHQCIALHRLITSGRQVLNPLLTQGLSDFVCLSAFLRTADGPRSIFIYIAYCLESYKSVTDKYTTSSKINVKFLLLDWQFANC